MSAGTIDILDQLFHEVTGAPPAAPSRGAIAKLSYTHDAMVDLIIANPIISQNDLAARFGYSAAWVSQVISSDAFQARLAERTKDLVDPTLRATVEDRFRGLVLRSLEILQHKLNGPANTIPDGLALRSLELSSRALGYGAKVEPKVEINVETHLEVLGSNLEKLLTRKRAEAVEGVFTRVTENEAQTGQLVPRS